jgi:hypothetical protein
MPRSIFPSSLPAPESGKKKKILLLVYIYSTAIVLAAVPFVRGAFWRQFVPSSTTGK